MFKEFNHLKNEQNSYNILSQLEANSLVFFQVTHSTPKNENKWQGDFKCNLFYSHRKSNCCGVPNVLSVK